MYKHLDLLSEDFDLVMIIKGFDEFLVLLKYLTCWKTENKAEVKAKIREAGLMNQLSEAEQEKLRKLNWRDSLPYKFFRNIFAEKAKGFGAERI